MSKQAVAISVIALAACAGAASADIIDITRPGTTLQQVLGNQFRVGDKIFSVASNGFNSSVFNASQIFISPVVNADPITGQGFRLTGAFHDVPGDNVGSEFVLAFSVDIAPEFIAQGYRFDNVQLRFNGAAAGSGSFSRVDETVLNGNNQNVGNGTVFANGGGASDFEDIVALARASGLTHLNMVKDVQFFANGANGSASASFVDQAFGQFITQGIPLPTAAGLGALGLGIVCARRRR
jgi:hypothetical protein